MRRAHIKGHMYSQPYAVSAARMHATHSIRDSPRGGILSARCAGSDQRRKALERAIARNAGSH